MKLFSSHSNRKAGRTLLLGMTLVMAFLVLTAGPAYAKSSNGGVHGNNGHHNGQTKIRSYDPDIIQMTTGSCDISTSTTSCGGGYGLAETFGAPLPLGDIVTVTVTYAIESGTSAQVSVSDSLGNNVTMVSEQCDSTSPVMCTAVGYFVVTVSGYDDIQFSVAGGSSGCLHFTAEDWLASNSALLTPVGTTGYCNLDCTTTLAMTPITFATLPNEVIAVSAAQAFFSAPLGSWTPTMTYSAFSNNDGGSFGYALLWQATNSTSTSYAFSSTTNITATTFAGAAEVLYM